MNDLPLLPYSEPLRLHQIGAGVQRRLTPDAEAMKRIARALDLQALDAFEAEINLVPTVSGWRLDGRVIADAVQTCGLTLEPLPVHVDRKFSVQMVEATERDDDERDDDKVEVIVPTSGTIIQSNDHVILFLPNKRLVHEVEALFRVGVTFF